MKDRIILTVTSLLSIVLFSLHWAFEIARGMEPGNMAGAGGLLILAVWLYGTLALAERKSGLIIMLVGSLLAAVVTLLHMQGKGMVGGRVAINSSGAFFWVWTLIALGANGIFSFVFTVREFWSLLRKNSPQKL